MSLCQRSVPSGPEQWGIRSLLHDDADGDRGGLVRGGGLFAEIDVGSRMAFGVIVVANDQVPGYPAESDGGGGVIHYNDEDGLVRRGCKKGRICGRI